MEVSKHAEKRIISRVKIPKRAVEGFVKRAVEGARTIADFDNPRVKSYIRDRYQSYNHVNLVTLFQDWLFLWHNEILVTVLVIPDWLKDEIAN